MIFNFIIYKDNSQLAVCGGMVSGLSFGNTNVDFKLVGGWLGIYTRSS